MIEYPDFIDSDMFREFLDKIYPPQDIAVRNSYGVEEEADTDELLDRLIYTAYYELYLAYRLESVPSQQTIINAVFHHGIHIWRSEGGRSARLDLIAQGVKQAGIVKESYDTAQMPFSPIVRQLLDGYKRTVALKHIQLEREMD